jgi:hypothetical protein
MKKSNGIVGESALLDKNATCPCAVCFFGWGVANKREKINAA